MELVSVLGCGLSWRRGKPVPLYGIHYHFLLKYWSNAILLTIKYYRTQCFNPFKSGHLYVLRLLKVSVACHRVLLKWGVQCI